MFFKKQIDNQTIGGAPANLAKSYVWNDVYVAANEIAVVAKFGIISGDTYEELKEYNSHKSNIENKKYICSYLFHLKFADFIAESLMNDEYDIYDQYIDYINEENDTNSVIEEKDKFINRICNFYINIGLFSYYGNLINSRSKGFTYNETNPSYSLSTFYNSHSKQIIAELHEGCGHLACISVLQEITEENPIVTSDKNDKFYGNQCMATVVPSGTCSDYTREELINTLISSNMVNHLSKEVFKQLFGDICLDTEYNDINTQLMSNLNDYFGISSYIKDENGKIHDNGEDVQGEHILPYSIKEITPFEIDDDSYDPAYNYDIVINDRMHQFIGDNRYVSWAFSNEYEFTYVKKDIRENKSIKQIKDLIKEKSYRYLEILTHWSCELSSHDDKYAKLLFKIIHDPIRLFNYSPPVTGKVVFNRKEFNDLFRKTYKDVMIPNEWRKYVCSYKIIRKENPNHEKGNKDTRSYTLHAEYLGPDEGNKEIVRLTENKKLFIALAISFLKIEMVIDGYLLFKLKGDSEGIGKVSIKELGKLKTKEEISDYLLLFRYPYDKQFIYIIIDLNSSKGSLNYGITEAYDGKASKPYEYKLIELIMKKEIKYAACSVTYTHSNDSDCDGDELRTIIKLEVTLNHIWNVANECNNLIKGKNLVIPFNGDDKESFKKINELYDNHDGYLQIESAINDNLKITMCTTTKNNQ